jgi:hypothetical protein
LSEKSLLSLARKYDAPPAVKNQLFNVTVLLVVLDAALFIANPVTLGAVGLVDGVG